jgi:hypothetical protein
MGYYKKVWVVLDKDGKILSHFFITKRDAMEWVEQQPDPNSFGIKKWVN